MTKTPRKSQSTKVNPTASKQMPVVITEEKTKDWRKLQLLDYVVLPLLYLESGIKWGYAELNSHIKYYTK